MKTDVKKLLKAACLRSRQHKTSGNRDEHFTMNDVDRIIAEMKRDVPSSPAEKVVHAQTIQPQPQITEKRVFKSASLSDILGFNPQKPEQTHAAKFSQHVPEKWKKQYEKLIQLQETLQKGEDTSSALILGTQETLQEVEAAIKRIFDGTYGICEITNLPIATERLESIPYARYSLEGQKQLEEAKRMRILAQQVNNQRISDGEEEEAESKRPFYDADEDRDLAAELEE